MKIQILGTGCQKCGKLADAVEKAVEASGTGCEIEKVTDINRIISFGVMMTPALVINGAVQTVGKVPSVEEIKELIKNTNKG